MTVLLWSPDAPTRCACAGAYRPQLNRHGKLVKAREPAWQMAEQTRAPDCLQERCRALAKLYQLGYQHHTDSRKSGKGYPDVHLWTTGRGSVFIELKRMDRDPTAEQVGKLIELRDAGHPVYLVRPCCLLVGVVDELMADFAGVRCRYAHGGPATPAPASTPLESDSAPPAPAPRRARPEPELPGTAVLEPFSNAVGYVVPLGGDSAATRELEEWLRAAGFPPSWTPFPIRFVVGDDAIVVQIRVRAGRVWRAGVPPGPLPEHLPTVLRADVVAGPTSDQVMWLLEAAPPSATLPDQAA